MILRHLLVELVGSVDGSLSANRPNDSPATRQAEDGDEYQEESAERRSEGAEKEEPEKKRERQPRPLSQRPPRRRVEQHLAALPYGERPRLLRL